LYYISRYTGYSKRNNRKTGFYQEIKIFTKFKEKTIIGFIMDKAEIGVIFFGIGYVVSIIVNILLGLIIK
jgi:hypothetical protein